MSESSLYLKAAEDFQDNTWQLAAYNSTGHCVVLAGPGSGKTKTLTVKLARILAEDIAPPRGVACITYNNQCARELESRLNALGIQPRGRVFIGTVHSFSLTQIVLPYAQPAGLELPQNFKVAAIQQQNAAIHSAYAEAIGGNDNPSRWKHRMEIYRRSILDRTSEAWHTTNPAVARLVKAYEAELRRNGLIDFDDMPLLALRALIENKWVREAILAKFPVLAVDEYQDLGQALHRMVLGLCFRTGIRLFAVGDADQSIYGFTGAKPILLQRLAARDDVETLRLPFNYRCGSQIVAASEYALGEERGYQAPEGAREGTIYFHPLARDYGAQARALFTNILPDVLNRNKDLTLGQIAVLYQKAEIGNHLAEAASDAGIDFVRTDGNALYPRSSRLMRWLELCAIWASGGWQKAEPRFSRIVGDGIGLFSDSLVSDELIAAFQRSLVNFLWNRNTPSENLHTWLSALRKNLLDEYLASGVQLAEEADVLGAFLEKLALGGPAEDMTLADFSGQGQGRDQITLSTLHSSKGREFRIVLLFGMDQGVIPWNNVNQDQQREFRRQFYVGFTRAEDELHIIYSDRFPSKFVVEVTQRLGVT